MDRGARLETLVSPAVSSVTAPMVTMTQVERDSVPADSKTILAPPVSPAEPTVSSVSALPRVALPSSKDVIRDATVTVLYQIMELTEALRDLQARLLLLAGDIEENPGPRRPKKKTIAKKGAYMVPVGMPLRSVGGKGGFMDWIGYLPRALGAGAGFLLDPSAAGAAKGWDIGGKISQAAGFGAYRRMLKGRGEYAGAGGDTHLPTTSGIVAHAAPVPVMHSGEEVTRVCRREYLGDVLSSATANAFSMVTIPVNPGLDDFLAWGSGVFRNYQEYCIKGLMVQFISSCSGYAAAGAIGTVTIAADYNAAAPRPTGQVPLEYLSGSRVSKASDDCDWYMECDPAKATTKNKYIRCGDVPAGQDVRLYDWCNLYVASSGVPTASLNLGKIYIVYDIAVYKPKIGTSLGINMAQYYTTAHTVANALGALTHTKIFDNIGVDFATATNVDTMTFRRGTFGNFYVILSWYGDTPTTALAYPVIGLVNTRWMKDSFRVSPTIPGANIYEAPGPGGAHTAAHLEFAIEVIDPAVTAGITVTNTITDIPVGTSKALQISVFEMPGGFPGSTV